jgi:hypothetical protein
MDPTQIPAEVAPSEHDFIVADADYYDVKARQCLRLARAAHDDGAAVALRSLALAFERQSRSLKE